MMIRKLSDLEARRRVLQAQAAQERADFAFHFEPIEKTLSWADKGVDAFNFLKNSPVVWTSAFAVLAHYRPKLADKVLALGCGAIKLLKSTKNLV
jgi:hypothetical protein